jgi:hypothetical protein
MKWKNAHEIETTGFYYWRSFHMWKTNPLHVIVTQISKLRGKNNDFKEFHIEMLLPVTGSAYDYNYSGPLRGLHGKFWGPLPIPTIDEINDPERKPQQSNSWDSETRKAL